MTTLSGFSAAVGRAAAIAAAAAALSTSARADVLVSNVEVPIRAVTILSQDLWAAQAFNTDGSSYELDAIEVLLGSLIGTPTLVAELHADAAGRPGSTLATFPIAGIEAGVPAVFTLAGSPVALNANSAYWLVLGATGAGSFGWGYAEGNAQAGPGSLGGYTYSSDSGASWGAVGTDNPYNLRVSVSAVPEAPTQAMLLLGLLCLAWRKTDSIRACLPLPRTRRALRAIDRVLVSQQSAKP
jgi:hypothetical protein